MALVRVVRKTFYGIDIKLRSTDRHKLPHREERHCSQNELATDHHCGRVLGKLESLESRDLGKYRKKADWNGRSRMEIGRPWPVLGTHNWELPLT